MKLCESINEELKKKQIKKIAKIFKDEMKSSNSDGFEITDVDGRVILDSEGDITSGDDEVEVIELSLFSDFKEYLNEISEEEFDTKLSDKDVPLVIKELKGMKIEREAQVNALTAGAYEYEDAGEISQDFDLELLDFNYNSKSDELEVKKFR